MNEDNFKFDYYKGDFKGISNHMNRMNWVECFNNQSVQSMYDVFITRLSEACHLHVPKINFNLRSKKKAP